MVIWLTGEGLALNLAQEMTGAQRIAEGAVGSDAAEYRQLDGWERSTRIATGTGAMAGNCCGRVWFGRKSWRWDWRSSIPKNSDHSGNPSSCDYCVRPIKKPLRKNKTLSPKEIADYRVNRY